jgi:N-acetylglucosamine-6-phosphate deacetylase
VAIDIDVNVESVPEGPYVAPGYVDVHVHGLGGHDAMGDPAALNGMARRLLRHGVTSFLPTAVTAPIDALVAFAERVRAWLPDAPADGAEPLGFNLEGPFLAASRHGAHDPANARAAHRWPPAAHDRARAARRDGLDPLAP